MYLHVSTMSNQRTNKHRQHQSTNVRRTVYRGGICLLDETFLFFVLPNQPTKPTNTEFVVDMQARLQRTQQEWAKRLEDFTQKYRSNTTTTSTSGGGGGSSAGAASRQSFQVLLQLFAYQDVLDDGRLDRVWQADGGRAVTFLVPQLLSFLLHGAASACSKELEEWILRGCRQNVMFAHRCFWFLRAWCLEVPLSVVPPTTATQQQRRQPPNRTNSDGRLSQRSSVNSAASPGGLVPFLDEPAPGETNRSSLQHCGDSVSRLLAPQSADPSLSGADDKFLPEERMVIEQLMLRVKEHGQEAALAYMVGRKNTHGGDELCQMADDGFHEDSVLLDRQASLPVNPNTGSVSQRHLQTVSSPRRYGFLPLNYAQQYRYTGAVHGSTEAFDETPRFWDSLIHLADSLFVVDRKERKKVLRESLQIFECEVLPSNAIYVPIHDTPHRVWRIVAEESIPLGTKERVPCIIMLEVVQSSDEGVNGTSSTPTSLHSFDGIGATSHRNAYCHRGRRKSSLLTLLDHFPGGHLSRMGNNGNVNGASAYSMSTGSMETDDEPQHDVDEFDLVEDWRFKPRHPLRRVPFMDKVADTMKGGLKRVSVTVRERLERDRTVSEELQALTLGESLVSASSETDQVSENGGTMGHRRRRKNVRREDTADDEKDDLLHRASSGNSLESMGQWGTPKPVKPTVDARRSSSPDVHSVRRRLDRDVVSADGILQGSSSNPLVYGSDQDEDVEVGYHDIIVPSLKSDDDKTPQKTTGERARPPPVVFRESWQAKQERIRATSAYGHHPGWRLLPVLVKANDDLRQEQMAAQLIYKMASILARERCPVWLCPYEILALTDSGGIIEAIPDTISLDSLKRNDPNFTNLRDFFHSYYGEDTTDLASAKANFVESLAAYSMVCFLLQIKDRHNGNILLDREGHMIHIDFGFFFLSSPGKNAGFESAPFKLTREFVEVLDGPKSHLFHVFRELCVRSFLALRKHCMEIILLVEMLKNGNEKLSCFRGRPDDAIAQLRERFRLDLNDRACREYVYSLIDNSIENWRTDWYDRYQRYFVGVL